MIPSTLRVPASIIAGSFLTSITIAIGLFSAAPASAQVSGHFSGTGSTCALVSVTLRLGSSDATTGGQVSNLQRYLTLTGDFTHASITGYYGPATEAAVQRFQCRVGIVCNGAPETTGYGVVGAKTRVELARQCRGGPVGNPSTGSDGTFGGTATCSPILRTLYAGHTDAATGSDVSKLQLMLVKLGYYTNSVSGTFDAATEDALKRFQCAQGITCTGNPDTTGYGLAGPRTRALLLARCHSGISNPPGDATGTTTTIVQCLHIPPRQCSNGTLVYAQGTPCTYAACPTGILSDSAARITGPDRLSINQTGTWTLTSPNFASGTYKMDWGDGTATDFTSATSYTHSFSRVGLFIVTAITKFASGLTGDDVRIVLVTQNQVGTTTTTIPGTSACLNWRPMICPNGSLIYPSDSSCTYAACPTTTTACTADYTPVCGASCGNQVGTLCSTTTYSNRCQLNAAGATFIYNGACTSTNIPAPTNPPQEGLFLQCPQRAMICADGSTVGPTGPDCSFVCPNSSGAIGGTISLTRMSSSGAFVWTDMLGAANQHAMVAYGGSAWGGTEVLTQSFAAGVNSGNLETHRLPSAGSYSIRVCRIENGTRTVCSNNWSYQHACSQPSDACWASSAQVPVESQLASVTVALESLLASLQSLLNR